MNISEQRPVTDGCPGLLSPHRADDGLLVRLRLPGGQTLASTLSKLSDIAGTFGQPDLQLTSRGNIQIRGIDADDLEPLTEAVAAAGLQPSVSHERVRNVVASPLTGLVGGTADARPLLRVLDQQLCATAELASLPGRFLFAIDDGRGDVTRLGFDLGIQLVGSGDALVLAGGPRLGFRVAADRAVDTVMALAMRFVELRAGLPSPPWHVREVDPAALDTRIGPIEIRGSGTRPPLGRFGRHAGTQVPLALLTPGQVAVVARVGSGPVVLTPWRGLVIAGAGNHIGELAAAGLVVDDASPWTGVTACVGAPGCTKSQIDTRFLATELVGLLGHRSPRLHVVGCERRCGAPATDHLDLVAPASVAAALLQIERRERVR